LLKKVQTISHTAFSDQSAHKAASAIKTPKERAQLGFLKANMAIWDELDESHHRKRCFLLSKQFEHWFAELLFVEIVQ
jgi:hypothetical protein